MTEEQRLLGAADIEARGYWKQPGGRAEAEMWALHRERHRLAARHAIYVILGLSLGLYALGWGLFVLLRAAVEAWVAPFL